MESDEETLGSLKALFDFILSTVSEKHDINPFITLLKPRCYADCGRALEPLTPVNNQEVAYRKRVANSLIGSLAERGGLELCAERGISPMCR